MTDHEEHRPDPDALLQRVESEESSARTRGRLKVFLGATAGVGKTFAMLEEARERQQEGIDVVVGVAETHGRQETEALLSGLTMLPRQDVEHRGVRLSEFDLDAALARRPLLIVVDELAHTNAPGSRHAKRWQDVEELLAAGIDVYTTVNVQHLESLKDLVARITHVVVRETVPDAVLDRADEIELIDLPPEDLLQRLREGKVYVPQQAKRAADSFFRKGNLIALRQMAMRTAAQRVDAQMRVHRRAAGIRETWPVHERLLVAVGPAPSSQLLVRATRRIADASGADWMAVFVETPEYANWSDADRARVWETLRLAESLGGSTDTISGASAGDAVLRYARRNNLSRIIVGKPTHPRWRDWIFGSKLDTLVRGSGDIDVYVLTGDSGSPEHAARAGSPLRRRSPVAAYVWAALVIVIATVVAVLSSPHFEIANLAMMYLLAIVLVAARFGRGPSIFASVFSVAAFDWFCVPPYNTFAVADTEYMVTFGVMLVVALTISTLTTRIALQAGAARDRERRTASLYAVSQALVRSTDTADLLRAGVAHLAETFDADTAVFLPDALGRLTVTVPSSSAFESAGQEKTVARWTFDNSRPAGVGTDTLPAAAARYVPLVSGGATLGVLGIRPSDPDRFRAPEQLHLLETFTALIAVAVEHARLAEDARRIRQLEEMDRLKSEFVAVASHELRTPLTSLAMEIELLRERMPTLPEREAALLNAAEEDVNRLRALVDDLLDLSKLESGRAELSIEPVAPGHLAGAALDAFRVRAEEQHVTLTADVDEGLPPVMADQAQLGRVLTNLVANALRHTTEGGRILIAADLVNDFVQFSVADNGSGIPLEDQPRLFDRFVQLADGRARDGTGLGLAISRQIVRAHGGEIWVDSGPGPGTVFSFTLPVAEAEAAGITGEQT